MLVTKPAVTTVEGKKLQLLNMSGEQIEFTRLEVGSGLYSDEEATKDALSNRTSLKDRKQLFGISSVSVTDDGDTMILSSMITNADLTEDYTIRELGLYARIKGQPDTERLISISLAEIEDDFPAYDGKSESRILMKYHFSVSNSDTVYLSYEHDPVALVEDVDAKDKVLQEQIDNLKKSVGDGKKLVADAITEKGVTTAADAAFSELAENIRSIDVELHGATISVSTEEASLIGKSATLTKDDTVVDTKTFDDNGACSFTDIQDTGDYTVSASDGTDSMSEIVTITSDNIVNKTVLSCVLSLIPDGSTVTPVDDVAIWLKCAGSKADYTTTAEVLADADTMFALTSDENAMKYLERSTSFADDLCADETFMTYLGQSPYVDDTVLNSDLWKQKIKASQYWSLVYSSKTVTVYGGAYETITIEGYYGGSFTTNADGSVSHVVPMDTITLTGSVSGQSFTRTVTSDTTDVYVMPDGLVPYWFGWCNPLTPNITNPISLGSFEITILTNGIKSRRTAPQYSACMTKDYNLDISNYSKMNSVYNEIADISANFGCFTDEGDIISVYTNIGNPSCYNKRVSVDTNGATTAVRFNYECSGNYGSTAYCVLGAFWFE